MPEASDEQFMLATLPPSRRQIRLALGVVVFLIVAFVAIAWFAHIPLRPVYAFVPTFEGVMLVIDLIISSLLFAQYIVVRRQPLLLLGKIGRAHV